ncbi:hypothetical protein R3W88_016440 [Solanum pinnatisectum]|uniref:Uncharacterized protein n=1 Tax=Solanum pinnatisectum TaxID=50273 RepID=A0AAV9KXE0_9SOLN|nr:hypothetical protein R3W88_016440 [Solanum pinnatisectum]
MSDQRPLLSMKKTFFYNFFPSKAEEKACKINNTSYKIIVGMLIILFFEMFEYILRYWTLDVAKSLENGCSVCVDMCNVTEENVPKKYEGGSVWFRKLPNDDFSLWCIELFNYRRLGDGDEIGLYWDPRSSTLVFKLLSQIVS